VVSHTSNYKIRHWRICFLRVISRKKEEKSSTDELPTKKIRRWFFCPTSRSSQESKGFFYRWATYKGSISRGSQGSRRVRQGWSVATKGGRRKEKKRNRPRKVVCRHKKGTWEKQEKKRKEKDQGRREGGSCEGKVPCALKHEFLFLVHEYLGFEATRLGWSIGSCVVTRKPCAKEFRDQTTLRSKSSTLKWLLYTPIKQEQYLKRTTLHRLKIPLQSIVARKVRTIALEQSAKKAVMRRAIHAIWHGYVENPAAKYS
jgi:hypothetical protein